MASLEELRAERIKKLEALKEKGVSSYPSTSSRTHELKAVLEDFASLESTATVIIVNGRVMTSRGQGAISFIDLYDGSSRVQVVIKLPESPEETMHFYREYVDIGDFVEVTGTAFVTKSGQQSILVTKVSMLSKALLPLPDKYHGIQDEELRMRVSGILIFLPIQSFALCLKRRLSSGKWFVHF
jgi:lysyl-tRNA synthetase, class II